MVAALRRRRSPDRGNWVHAPTPDPLVSFRVLFLALWIAVGIVSIGVGFCLH